MRGDHQEDSRGHEHGHSDWEKEPSASAHATGYVAVQRDRGEALRALTVPMQARREPAMRDFEWRPSILRLRDVSQAPTDEIRRLMVSGHGESHNHVLQPW